MKKLLFCIFLFSPPDVFAQFSRYVIQLKDKNGTPYAISEPSKFLTQRSLERRARYHIDVDQSDLPVTPAYIDSIRLSGNVSILNVSRWFNQVCIRTKDAAALTKINGFSFVTASSPVAARKGTVKMDDPDTVTEKPAASINLRPQNPADFYNYGVAYAQVHLHNEEFLHNLGFRGNGMQLALMDAGFYHYKTLPTFDSVRNNSQILGTWDFVANEASVDEDYVHGMDCLSTIAANIPGTFVGTAPKSSFYLYRTEDISSEYPIEEQNWIAAAEKADSLGADIFSVSLGYNIFDNSKFSYTYADMNGHTTIISKACNLAAKKGILIVVAAGNEGNGSWKYITTPADADSVLAVGAVSSSKQVAGFSSYGPSSDGQVKPDVAAIGLNTVIADQNTGGPVYGNGTSYACPVMAGIIACLWQAFPEVDNMSIINALRKASDRADMPDDRTGYGIPDAKKAFVSLLKKLYRQQAGTGDSCKPVLAFTVKAAKGMNVVIERKLPAGAAYTPVATINFTGNFATANYIYKDSMGLPAAASTISYRLKMNIGADTSFYLDSITINYRPCKIASEKITISPNPVTDKLTVSVIRDNPSEAVVVLYSIAGQKIYTRSEHLSGAQTITIPMKQVSRGVYFIALFLNSKKALIRKIIRD